MKSTADKIIEAVEESKGRVKSKGTQETVDFLKLVFAEPKLWKYYTERGERKRKLKLMSFEGIEARALFDAHEHKSTDITSSYCTGRNGSAVFEFFMEETLD